jgi:hypothetical protein
LVGLYLLLLQLLSEAEGFVGPQQQRYAQRHHAHRPIAQEDHLVAQTGKCPQPVEDEEHDERQVEGPVCSSIYM